MKLTPHHLPKWTYLGEGSRAQVPMFEALLGCSHMCTNGILMSELSPLFVCLIFPRTPVFTVNQEVTQSDANVSFLFLGFLGIIPLLVGQMLTSNQALTSLTLVKCSPCHGNPAAQRPVMASGTFRDSWDFTWRDGRGPCGEVTNRW